MYKSETAQDLLHTQLNVENPNKENSTLITNESLDGTPFALTGNEDNGYFIRFGNYILSPKFKDKDSPLTYIDQNMYTVITNLIITLIDMDKKVPVKL